eukprot:TRINITY_DN10768_c0_g1_i1.p1 TRINITY_DN10768_c0_g1~~TRINITY_DN10768_c0_g1_i1.p1  ORF type:complete len:831 (-),score=195.50 TRINITY_DN10768_c0_g1_i1:358-2850(-)
MEYGGTVRAAAIPSDLRHMHDELEAMGGGDTRIAPIEVHCRIQPLPANSTPLDMCARAEGSNIIIRDLRQPSAISERNFPVNSALPANARQSDMYATLGEDALDWIWDGFNASVVAHGQTGTGKSYSLFGHGVIGEADGEGICPRLLAALYNRIDHTQHPDFYTVGISCWDVQANDVVDLLADPEAAGGGKMTTVHAPNLKAALLLLQFARMRSINWSRAMGTDTQQEFLPNRAHAFVRIVLYNAVQRRVSTLHIVDLVGSQVLAGAKAVTFKSQQVSQEREREKRAFSQHLLAFGRMLTELYSQQQSGGAAKLTSVRETKLNQFLGSLFAGNSKVFMLLTVASHKDYYLDTMNTLRMGTRVQNVSTPCVRLLNVDIGELQFVPSNTVLRERWEDYPLSVGRPSANAAAPSADHLGVSFGAGLRAEDLRVPDRPAAFANFGGLRQQHQTRDFTDEDEEAAAADLSMRAPDRAPMQSSAVHAQDEDDHTQQTQQRQQQKAPAPNYNIIVAALHRTEREKNKLQDRVKELEHDLLERATQFQLEIDDLKAEKVLMGQQLRKASRSAHVDDVFEHYEADIGRLNEEVKNLRQENLVLAERLRAMAEPLSLSEKKLPGVSVRKILEKMHDEYDKLRREYEDNLKTQRQMSRHKKCFEDSNRKLTQLSRDFLAKEAVLVNTHDMSVQMNERLQQYEAELASSRQMESSLRQQLASSVEQTRALLEQIAELKMSAKKSEIFQRAARTGAAARPSAPKREAMELCLRLERELGANNPRQLALLHKLQRQVEVLERERADSSAREAELVNSLVDYQRKGTQDAKKLVHIMKDAYSKMQ